MIGVVAGTGARVDGLQNDTNPYPKIPTTQVAHSAGGWISRLYLSTAAYDGRAYNGARFVSTLVTLGSPHVRMCMCTH